MNAYIEDMVLFLWAVLREPVYAAIAIATAITIVIVVASYFNPYIRSNSEKDIFYHG